MVTTNENPLGISPEVHVGIPVEFQGETESNPEGLSAQGVHQDASSDRYQQTVLSANDTQDLIDTLMQVEDEDDLAARFAENLRLSRPSRPTR